jgi:hypothetical protein
MQQQNIEDIYCKFNMFFDEQVNLLHRSLNRAGRIKAKNVLSEIIPKIGQAFRKLNPDNTSINQYCLKKKILEAVEASKCKLDKNEIYSIVIQFFQKPSSRSDPPLAKPPKSRHRKDIEQLSLFA